ncbi:MAG: tRNA lysidine(34) synthetase TilS [Flavisolibacter sp.]
MDLQQQFDIHTRDHPAFQKNGKHLLAVSGGMDSAVLCRLCKGAGLDFSIAHCNFNLRGMESERDEQFVRGLGEKYGVPVWIRKFDTMAFARDQKLSIQEAARDLRYGWFAQLRKEQGFSWILLGHHADDNIETLLMHFFRGTGLGGLTGIPAEDKKNRLLRPLLAFRRKEMEAFAREKGLEWVEDSSNNSLKYTRNFFRLELIPALQKVYPHVVENLLHNIERFKKINTLYQDQIRTLKEDVCETHLQETRIPLRKLRKYANTSLLYEIIKDFGFGEKQLGEVEGLVKSPSGRFVENSQNQIIKHRNWLVIAPKTSEARNIAIARDQPQTVFGMGILNMQWIVREKTTIMKSASIAQLDARLVTFPLLLRQWKPGDYFYPLGMPKKKKLARFLIDQKMSKNQKENVWVVESEKKIIWIVGLRIDDRFKITPATQEILQLSVTSL